MHIDYILRLSLSINQNNDLLFDRCALLFFAKYTWLEKTELRTEQITVIKLILRQGK